MDNKQRKINRALSAYGGYRQRQRAQFEQNIDAALPLTPPAAADLGEFEAERIRPARAPGLESDVLVPLGWSAVAAGSAFLLSGYVIVFFGAPWHIIIPATIIPGVVIFFLGTKALQQTLWQIERIFQTDYDGDGQIGEPAALPEPAPIPLEITRRSERGTFEGMFRFSLPDGVGESLFQEWSESVVKTGDLTQSRWVSKNRFKRDQYTELLARLQEAGIVARAGTAKNAPYELTDSGKLSLNRYARACAYALGADSDGYQFIEGVG